MSSGGQFFLSLDRSRRKFQSDHESDIATDEDIGEQRKALAIARNFLRMNMPIEQIATGTGLTVEEVENLRTGI